MPELFLRKPAGYVRVDRPEGPPLEFNTLQCVHCDRHWTVIPGSGRRRGFCMKCNGPTCGAEKCWQCRPADLLIYGE